MALLKRPYVQREYKISEIFFLSPLSSLASVVNVSEKIPIMGHQLIYHADTCPPERVTLEARGGREEQNQKHYFLGVC